MSKKPACRGCARLQRENDELHARVDQLEGFERERFGLLQLSSERAQVIDSQRQTMQGLIGKIREDNATELLVGEMGKLSHKISMLIQMSEEDEEYPEAYKMLRALYKKHILRGDPLEE